MSKTSNPVPVSAEVLAHQLLRLVGDYPAEMGRLRVARTVGGFSTPAPGAEDLLPDLSSYVVESMQIADDDSEQWLLRDVVALLDALIAGGLVTQSPGARPTCVLTRAGHRALDALEVNHV